MPAQSNWWILQIACDVQHCIRINVLKLVLTHTMYYVWIYMLVFWKFIEDFLVLLYIWCHIFLYTISNVLCYLFALKK